MVLKEIEGDLLSTECDVVCVQVNCLGYMNYGVSKAIRKRYPLAYEQYSRFLYNNSRVVDGKRENTRDFLGLCQISKAREGKYIAMLYGQELYGADPKMQYTDYDALLCSLFALRRLVLFGDYGIKSLAFPYMMGCGKSGGAKWEKVREMIEAVFNDLDVTVEIRRIV